MSRFLLSVILLLGLSPAMARAQTSANETVTVEGEIVDIGCYAAREAKGIEHESCAARCLKNGNPAGLLAADGQVYTIAAAAPPFTDFAAKKVRLTGSLRGSLLRPTEMSVWRDEKWAAVPLTQHGAPQAVESD
jgi:hypothetical protein